MPGTEIRIEIPAVRDLAETIVRRLDADVVDADLYLAEMKETLERKRNAIAEAFLADELQADQAEHSSFIAEQQIELVEAIIRGRAHDARLASVERLRAERAKLETPIDRIAFDNDPRNGTTAERILAMTDDDARLPFEAVVALTGDRARAETAEAALVAAAQLCRDHQDALGTAGALKAARASVYITENGTYAGILTAFARMGETRVA